MSMLIGLTGPTGAGKSTASKVAVGLGFQVIDCDKLAREAVIKGSKGLLALVSVFGEDITLSDGSLNRKKLAEKAFASKEKTELLNKTLLPYIVSLVWEKITEEKVLLDAPTLFESGLNLECGYTIAVLAKEELRLKRKIERDSITKEQALLRIRAGKPDSFYTENADYVVYNNGDEETLKTEFINILKNREEGKYERK